MISGQATGLKQLFQIGFAILDIENEDTENEG